MTRGNTITPTTELTFFRVNKDLSNQEDPSRSILAGDILHTEKIIDGPYQGLHLIQLKTGEVKISILDSTQNFNFNNYDSIFRIIKVERQAYSREENRYSLIRQINLMEQMNKDLWDLIERKKIDLSKHNDKALVKLDRMPAKDYENTSDQRLLQRVEILKEVNQELESICG